MSSKTRKRIWLMPVAAAIGVVAILAVLAATVWTPSTAQAQTPFEGPGNLMATEVSATQINLSWRAGIGQTSYEVQRMTGSGAFATVSTATNPGNVTTYMDMGLMPSTMYTYQVRGVNVDGMSAWSAVAMATTMAAAPPPADPPAAMLDSSSSTGSAAVKLILTIDLDENLTGSNWVEIYLEDDYQEPGSIAKEDVVFEARGTPTTGGSRVDVDTTFAAADVEIDDGGDLNGEDNAVVISARIPDMKDGDDTGYPLAGQTLIMVVSRDADIKNPSEAGKHDNGFSIIPGTVDRAEAAQIENIGAGKYANDDGELTTAAKISLSADDGGRGASLKITGSGFNDGTTASVEVLQDTDGMVMVDDDAGGMRAISCEDVLADGISLGSATVGSNNEFELDITVHQDQFTKGSLNYICAKDNEAPDNQFAEAPKVFELTKSLTVSPADVSSGDEVTIKPRDFPGILSTVNLGGSKVYDASDDEDDKKTGDEPSKNDFDVDEDGSSDFVFDMPGGLSGTVQVAVTYYQIKGGVDDRETPTNADVEGAKDVSTTKNVSITVNSAGLSLSSTEVAANATVIISGRGFNDDSCIRTSDITIKDIVSKRLVVDSAGVQTGNCTEGDYIQTTSSGEFTATISIWTHDSDEDNPALDDGDYKIEAKDIHGFKGSATVTILEPTVSVMPEMVSPRDFITISGENWPISSADRRQRSYHHLQ